MKPTLEELQIAIAHLKAVKLSLRTKKSASAKVRMTANVEAAALDEVIRYLELQSIGSKR